MSMRQMFLTSDKARAKMKAVNVQQPPLGIGKAVISNEDVTNVANSTYPSELFSSQIQAWSGTNQAMKFTGATLEALLLDQDAELASKNSSNIISSIIASGGIKTVEEATLKGLHTAYRHLLLVPMVFAGTKYELIIIGEVSMLNEGVKRTNKHENGNEGEDADEGKGGGVSGSLGSSDTVNFESSKDQFKEEHGHSLGSKYEEESRIQLHSAEGHHMWRDALDTQQKAPGMGLHCQFLGIQGFNDIVISDIDFL
ncbi:hypothetical protein BX616_007598 [Lobosporangium transversale]|uniref:Uncharacterized protein n=1 Tax=Lobosporangium transversale TaxID=64571 RepID=A0A1Y2G5Z7_9FUNG|nr:hypothetical protein BCR41DRAFT_426722 [Lobosporangium transversale]KAF9918584.1 hypothetical protein BX616_007598 [Lobosporangium transversale]ORY96976.1 hypothetical protein BCR41DRAFT_426722 [Lobosporangium transversale]|eukprot:XP_021875538.1 hypothetical protein BCR41DRAFT_426722 [Lobosporangium transversale]